MNIYKKMIIVMKRGICCFKRNTLPVNRLFLFFTISISDHESNIFL